MTVAPRSLFLIITAQPWCINNVQLRWDCTESSIPSYFTTPQLWLFMASLMLNIIVVNFFSQSCTHTYFCKQCKDENIYNTCSSRCPIYFLLLHCKHNAVGFQPGSQSLTQINGILWSGSPQAEFSFKVQGPLPSSLVVCKDSLSWMTKGPIFFRAVGWEPFSSPKGCCSSWLPRPLESLL